MAEARIDAGLSAFERDNSVAGVLFLCAGITIFSLQDVAVKWLSGDYAVTEIVFVRSLIGVPLLLMLVGIDRSALTLKSRHPWLNLLRSSLMFVSYVSFYLALSALSLAETVAIAFSSPMFITLFSVIFLGATVGTRRWGAIVIGFLGVFLITRPGAAAFEPAALLAVLCAITYAGSVILSRKIGRNDSSALMSFYAAAFYLVASGLLGLLLGDGAYATSSHPSIQFLLREWQVPTVFDTSLMLGAGVISAFGFYFLTQAYRLGESSVVAPFEYTGLIWATIWGFVFWRELPDTTTIVGITLIVGAGLFVILRERQRNRLLVAKRGRLRLRSGY